MKTRDQCLTVAVCLLAASASSLCGQTSTWQPVLIPGLPANCFLGLESIWVRSENEVYAFASRTTPATVDVPESFVYRWDGATWSQVLHLAGHYAGSVSGAGASDVFVTANRCTLGPTAGCGSNRGGQVYRSTDRGATWTQQVLPAQVGVNQVHGVSGTLNNMHVLSDGGRIIRFNGTLWETVFTDPANFPYQHTFIGADEGYYVTCWGWGKWDGSSWAYHGSQFDFCDIYDTWALRDQSSGVLHWYAVGNNNFSNGIRVWKFNPALQSFGGKLDYVFSDGSAGNIGGALGVWGSAADDVYVVGGLAETSGGMRTGRIYHYNGLEWARISSVGTIPQAFAVAGSGRDDVWVALGDGGLLHYGPPPQAADLALTIVPSPNPATVASNLTYVVTVTNSGPTAATALLISTAVPNGVDFINASTTGGSWTNSAGTITWSIPTLASGGTANLTAIVRPTVQGTISCLATVTASTSDPEPTNNSVSLLVLVKPTTGATSWQFVTISDLPDGFGLGSVWTRSRNEVYVWAWRPAGTTPVTAALYRTINAGGTWTRVPGMIFTNYSPGSVFGTGGLEVFASIHNPGAQPSRIFRSVDGGLSFAEQPLPASVGSRQLRPMQGTPGNIHMSIVGGDVVRFNGTDWTIIYSDPGEDVYAIAMLSPDEGYYATCWGWGWWDGNVWRFNGRQFDFCDIYGIWGVRDGSGRLHLYAVGNNNFSNGIRIWQFDVTQQSFGGKQQYVFGDGDGFDIGGASGIWGAAADEIYVIGGLGTVSGGERSGRIYYYDGVNWSRVTELGEIPHPGGIHGTARDDVWISLADGRLLHWTRPLVTGDPPVITAQPQSQTVPEGSGFVLSVSAVSATMYQWRLNGSDITGATNATFTVLNARLSDGGSYAVVASNDAGSVASNPALIMVLPPLGRSYSNNASITINDASSAAPYPSTITVSDITDAIWQVNVTLMGFTHTFPSDVGVLLVGPSGQKVVLMNRAGQSGADAIGVWLRFEDTASRVIPSGGALVSGLYRPADHRGGPYNFPVPAPEGPYDTSLSAFTGTSANGTWSLYVSDNVLGDTGAITNGWSLGITPQLTIIGLTNVFMPEDTTHTQVFRVANDWTATPSFTFTKTSTQPGIVPANNIVITPVGASGVDFAVTVSPISFGSNVVVRITAQNTQGQTVAKSFVVDVGHKSGADGRSYTNAAPIAINDNTFANPYPSTITITDYPGAVSQVNVTLRGFTHTFPSDVGVLLVGPTGQKVVLMKRAGQGSAHADGAWLTFDQGAPSAVPSSGVLTSGAYKPADYRGGSYNFPTPAPEAAYATSLDAFSGTPATGTWSLYVYDEVLGDSGAITHGWTLAITPKPVIIGLTNVYMLEDSTHIQRFTLAGDWTVPPSFSFTKTSSQPGVIPLENINITPADSVGTDFTLTVDPISFGSNVVIGVIAHYDQGQSVSHSVTVDVGEEPAASWRFITIPGLPSGFRLGNIWARNRNEIYLWAWREAGAGYLSETTLYRTIDGGDTWAQVPGMFFTNYIPANVFGVGGLEVFAAIHNPGRAPSRMFRSVDGGLSFVEQPLPSAAGARQLRQMHGTAGNVHMSIVGGDVVRFDGTNWGAIHSDPNEDVYALTMLNPEEGYFTTCWGWGGWDGSLWRFHGRQFDFCDIYGMWGMRDPAGRLHLYAVGNNNFANGIRIWQFDEISQSFRGKMDYVFSEGNGYNIGGATGIWGAAADDIYVIGGLATVSGGHRSGRIYHYDGVNWSRVTGLGEIPHPGGIHGTARDDVWVTLTDGRLLHLGDKAGTNDPPLITTQPQSQTVVAGKPASFVVQARGAPPLRYQWFINASTPLSAATAPVLILPRIGRADQAIYQVLVTNLSGSVTSAPATLSVVVPPAFILQPRGTNVTVGSSVTLSVSASGASEFQWRKNGANIEGATDATLTISNAQLNDGGSYTVVAANEAGVVTSDIAEVLVTPQFPPILNNDFFATPARLELVVGLPVVVAGFNTNATKEVGEPNHAERIGGRSVWFNWRASDTGIAQFNTYGSTFDTVLAVYLGNQLTNLLFVAANDDDDSNDASVATNRFFASQVRFNVRAGTDYRIALDGFGGRGGYFVLAGQFEPTIALLPVITNQPQSQVERLAATVRFIVGAAKGPFSYQWYFNGEPLPGAVGPELLRQNIDGRIIGTYSVRVTDALTGQYTDSRKAVLEISSAPEQALVFQDKLDRLVRTPEGAGPRKRVFTSSEGDYTGFYSVAAGTVGYHLGNNVLGRTDLNEVNHGDLIGLGSLYLAFTTTNAGTLVVDTRGSLIDNVFAVYRDVPDYNVLRTNVLGFATNAVKATLINQVQVTSGPSGEKYLVVADGIRGQRGTLAINWGFGTAPRRSDPVSAEPAKRWARGSDFTLRVTDPSVTNALPVPVYRWYRDEQFLAETSVPFLLVPGAALKNSGTYFVIASNAFGSITNWLDRVLVTAPISINPASSRFVNGEFELTLTGTEGDAVVLQTTSDLVGWTGLASLRLVGYEQKFRDSSAGLFDRRFYRLLTEEPLGPASGPLAVTLPASMGEQVGVEASTNLQDWIPILTNAPGSAPTLFPDGP